MSPSEGGDCRFESCRVRQEFGFNQRMRTVKGSTRSWRSQTQCSECHTVAPQAQRAEGMWTGAPQIRNVGNLRECERADTSFRTLYEKYSILQNTLFEHVLFPTANIAHIFVCKRTKRFSHVSHCFRMGIMPSVNCKSIRRITMS